MFYLRTVIIVPDVINQTSDSQMDLKEKYITDEQGNRIGVLLDIEAYQKLLEELEELEEL